MSVRCSRGPHGRLGARDGGRGAESKPGLEDQFSAGCAGAGLTVRRRRGALVPARGSGHCCRVEQEKTWRVTGVTGHAAPNKANLGYPPNASERLRISPTPHLPVHHAPKRVFPPQSQSHPFGIRALSRNHRAREGPHPLHNTSPQAPDTAHPPARQNERRHKNGLGVIAIRVMRPAPE